jgi:hypothetical protein
METIIFRNFFAQLTDVEIDFVINQLNRHQVFGFQIMRSNVGDIDAKFVKLFVRTIDVGILGTVVVHSIDNKIQL